MEIFQEKKLNSLLRGCCLLKQNTTIGFKRPGVFSQYHLDIDRLSNPVVQRLPQNYRKKKFYVKSFISTKFCFTVFSRKIQVMN